MYIQLYTRLYMCVTGLELNQKITGIEQLSAKEEVVVKHMAWLE